MRGEELRELTADASAAGLRLDRYLSRVTGLTRSQIQRLIEAGRVLVESRRSKASAAVLTGQRIRLSIPPPQPSALTPEAIPLNILY